MLTPISHKQKSPTYICKPFIIYTLYIIPVPISSQQSIFVFILHAKTTPDT